MCKSNYLYQRLTSAGILNNDGEPNEEAIFEIALSAFCYLVEAIRNGMYSAEQVKNFFKECECSGNWRAFYFYLCGYYTATDKKSAIEWDIVNDELAFYVYRYYFIEMVNVLDEVLSI